MKQFTKTITYVGNENGDLLEDVTMWEVNNVADYNEMMNYTIDNAVASRVDEVIDKRQAREYIVVEILREARRYSRTREDREKVFGLTDKYEIVIMVMDSWVVLYVDDVVENRAVYETKSTTSLLEISKSIDEILDKYYTV